jgi:hypothetical protein
MLHKVFAALAATSALVAPLASHAGTLNFDFSFTGVTPFSPDAGTVTGEIFGLTDNATSAPTDVVIFSAPAALGPLPSTPWDIYTVAGIQFGDSGLSNNFTVTGGVITATNYGVFEPGIGDTILDLGYSGLNVFFNNPGTAAVITDKADVIFTPAASTGGGVPEPAAWALMITGFFGLGGMLRRTRRTALA